MTTYWLSHLIRITGYGLIVFTNIDTVIYGALPVASDQQWDGTVANAGIAGGMTIYRNELYSTSIKWDRTNLTTWNTNGGSFSAMISVNDRLYVSHKAPNLPGLQGNGVAGWDGANWSALGAGIRVTDYGPWVLSLAASDSAVYVGGSFMTAGAIGAWGIARWDGNDWSALGDGTLVGSPEGDNPGKVYAIVHTNGLTYVGGYFDHAGSLPVSNIAQWDGTNWTSLGGGVGTVNAMAYGEDGLYVGGQIDTTGNGPANNIARWDGERWHALGSGVTGGSLGVQSIAVAESNVYVAGTFTNAGGVAANNIARWDGANWHALGSGLTGGVPSVIASHLLIWGSDLLVSGRFGYAGGKPSTNFAIWHMEPTSPLLPPVKIEFLNGVARLSWPTDLTNAILQSTVAPTENWADLFPQATTNWYDVPVTNTSRFFRLMRP